MTKSSFFFFLFRHLAQVTESCCLSAAQRDEAELMPGLSSDSENASNTGHRSRCLLVCYCQRTISPLASTEWIQSTLSF